MSLPKRILVPTDFSETSDRALDYAIDLASRIGASVVVMHAYELPMVVPYSTYIPSADVGARIATAAQSGLDAVVTARIARGVDLKKVLKQDAPWDAVNTVAKEVGADLVVCGTHGRKGLAHALLGSVRREDRPDLGRPGPHDPRPSRRIEVVHGLRIREPSASLPSSAQSHSNGRRAPDESASLGAPDTRRWRTRRDE